MTDRGRFVGAWCRRNWAYLAVAIAFVASRLVYRAGLGVRLDRAPVYWFLQYIDPWFYDHDFLRSILYLHQQAPLYNLLVGTCLRLFGASYGFFVLDGLYVALGLTTALGMTHVMLRMGAHPALAIASAVLYSVAPVTVLYEAWLLYETPVTALLVVSVVLLLRYYRRGTLGAGLWFFGLLAVLALFRATFGSIFLIVSAFVLLARPPHPERAKRSARWQVVRAAALPLLVVVSINSRIQLLTGHGFADAMLWDNLAQKTYQELPAVEQAFLLDHERISRALEHDAFSDLSGYGALRVPHEPTGVPLLDLEHAPNGNTNHHAIEHVLISEKYYKKDAIYLISHYPAAYFTGVWKAFRYGYFMSPADSFVPPRGTNHECLDPVTTVVDGFYGRSEGGTHGLLVFVLPLTFLYGVFRMVRSRAALESERADVGATSYMLLLVLYVTATTTLVSYSDFSRYRFDIDPFYVVLFTLLVQQVYSMMRYAVRMRSYRWAVVAGLLVACSGTGDQGPASASTSSNGATGMASGGSAGESTGQSASTTLGRGSASGSGVSGAATSTASSAGSSTTTSGSDGSASGDTSSTGDTGGSDGGRSTQGSASDGGRSTTGRSTTGQTGTTGRTGTTASTTTGGARDANTSGGNDAARSTTTGGIRDANATGTTTGISDGRVDYDDAGCPAVMPVEGMTVITWPCHPCTYGDQTCDVAYSGSQGSVGTESTGTGRQCRIAPYHWHCFTPGGG